MPDVSIRVASPRDAAVIARLMTALNDAVGPPYGLDRTPATIAITEEQARRRIERMTAVEQVLLANDADTAIGLLSLRIVPYLSEDAPYAEVTELYVAPEKRRRGIARRLLAAAEAIARGRGCTSIHVNAWRDNFQAQDLYHVAGYEAVELGFEKRLSAAD